MRRKRAQSSPLNLRPLWRRALVVAGAALLLLVAIGLCVASQQRVQRLQSGIAVATPDLHVLGCEADAGGMRLFYARGQPFGIPLETRRASAAGLGVSINTRLQGTDTNLFARWWLVLAFLGVLVAFAGRDLAAGIAARRRLAGGRCERCGYDLRATPDRCPECGAAAAVPDRPPHDPPMRRPATASGGGAVE